MHKLLGAHCGKHRVQPGVHFSPAPTTPASRRSSNTIVDTISITSTSTRCCSTIRSSNMMMMTNAVNNITGIAGPMSPHISTSCNSLVSGPKSKSRIRIRRTREPIQVDQTFKTRERLLCCWGAINVGAGTDCRGAFSYNIQL